MTSTQKKRMNQRKVADGLFGEIVRGRGRCEADSAVVACNGRLQCAHGFSRRYIATRFRFDNAWCLCAAHHVYWTTHPLEFDEWMRYRMGEASYLALRRAALRGGQADYKSLIPALRVIVQQMEAA